MQTIQPPSSDEETEFIFDSNQVQINESKTKICKANEEIKQLTESNKELITQLNRQNELLELKHKQNQQLQSEASKLKEQVDDRELKLLQSMKEKQQIQNELISMHEILDQTTQRNDQLNSEVFALRLTMEQLQQTATICKDESNQAVQKELRFKEQIDQQMKIIKQQEEAIRKLNTDLNQKMAQYKMDIQNRDIQIQDLKKQHQQQIQQNQEIITELIDQKNQNIQNSVYRKDFQPEITRMTKEIEELKNQLKGQTYQVVVFREKEQQLNIQIQNQNKFCQDLQVQNDSLTQNLAQKEKEIIKIKSDQQSQLSDKENLILQLNNQLQLLRKQDQKISLQKSVAQNADEKLLRDLQTKNEQIAMLQNENNQLVKLIESLKSQKIDNQGNEQVKIKQLESELKNLQSFIYESPLVVLFNLLEDRLSKQQQKSFENKRKINEFWTGQLKQWTEGFEELKQAFSGLKIFFKYELKYPSTG